MAKELTTARLTLRPWRIEDAETALGVYGDASIAKWLSPAMDTVTDLAAMRLVLQHWIGEDERLVPPAGRWAIERREDGRVIGGAVLLPLPPGGDDLEMGWHLHRDVWGQGYAVGAGQRVARWAFDEGLGQGFAGTPGGRHSPPPPPPPPAARAAARHIGMDWVGETDKYYGLRLQVFRMRPADLEG
ncbi:GNAT family N-acetyltransferase [Micromonospora sp. CPCC 205371]|nr:GNAT family N-acetyltransferase [Micromonospora sp. CPCC 205371]